MGIDRPACLKGCYSALLLSCILSTACGGGGGSSPPASMVQPETPPPETPREPEGSSSGESERLEVVIGFPSLLPDNPPDLSLIAEEEARRVRAMHARGGTGAGQTVGSIDGGAHRDHSDLQGKFAHICALGRCDDGRPNRADHSPLYDTPPGHGTLVNGVIAARKNGSGVYGIAHEAQIASYGNVASTSPPWGNGGERGHEWSSLFDQEVARGFDWMKSLGVRVVNNSWFRTYGWSADRGLTASSVRNIMPRSLTAFEAYVDAGGVAVWAAGNGMHPNPSVEAVLPKYFPELEKGWVAVVALGERGEIEGSYECGVAAEWCIAAPGIVTTTNIGGRWTVAGGTSIAAPYVAGGLAALKSLFPNLSYQDLRTASSQQPTSRARMPTSRTMDKVGSIWMRHRGRSAARTSHWEPRFGTGIADRWARVVLPRAAISQHFSGRSLVVLDGFQRAPEIRLDAFPSLAFYLSLDDLAWRHGAVTATGRRPDGRLDDRHQFQAQGVIREDSLAGFARGAGVMQGLAEIGGVPLPVNGYQMSKDATGATLGLTNGFGRWQAILATDAAKEPGRTGSGISGWNPGAVLAVSFAPHRGSAGTEVFGAAIASDFRRPMGWNGSGALALRGDSFELAWGRNVVTRETFRVDLMSRLTHLEVRSSPLLHFDDPLLASVDVEVSYRPHDHVTVGARLGTERPASSRAGQIRVATGVNDRLIAYQDVTVDSRTFLPSTGWV